ncbi:SGNH hydrolase-like domain-containing protein, acetyltransferase AlgX [Lachnospiraceae bacterium NE2001]|nr:SGNH hydrolase-like domain-containing protein, acetyltransferase AlgX [Lachnospiraceae bacterium NE2001]
MNKIKAIFMVVFFLLLATGAICRNKYNDSFIELNGYAASKLGMNSYYSDKGVYVTDDKYIASAVPKTSTDYEYNEMVSFNQFLQDNDIQLLYVNKPTKYNDDAFFYDNFGYESYCNRNADLFLERIGKAGINYIDLRKNMDEEGISSEDIFYRTDHHWTTKAGLWATEIIADELNRDYGYKIDTSIYDIDNYSVNEWQECWLGEQGKLLSRAYVGLDDYTELKPKFETDFTLYKDKGESEDGTFDDFIIEDRYDTESNVYHAGSWHYSYLRINNTNNLVDYGKVLMICDSYDHVTIPFLSLGVHHVDSLLLRGNVDELNLRDYILENGYDTVIISYAEFMIGAHDSEDNANYNMFTFD